MIAISPLTRRPETGCPPRATRSRGRGYSARRGSLLAEVIMSTVVLIIVMGMTVKVLGWVAIERRAADRREQAVVLVANLMERLAARPYAEVTPDLAREYTAPAKPGPSLPDGDLKVDIAESQPGAGRSAKRIAIQLRWRERSGEWASPVRLTSWLERRRTNR